MSIEKLKPAEKADVRIYSPYYQGNKRNLLPFAISLYKQGSFEGERRIEGGESIPFVASWFVSKLPSEMTRCRLQFDGNAELSYEVTIANSQLVDYLLEVIMTFKSSRTVDFSRAFYRKLLRIEE
ncbi:MAG: type IV pilus biogenesis protein EbsA [Spirulinaceae cyanobacterium]